MRISAENNIHGVVNGESLIERLMGSLLSSPLSCWSTNTCGPWRADGGQVAPPRRRGATNVSEKIAEYVAESFECKELVCNAKLSQALSSKSSEDGKEEIHSLRCSLTRPLAS